MRQQSHVEGIISRAGALAHPYAYVPFEVPPRCTRIEVAYHYAPVSPTDEPATLDIGLFDIRGTEPHTGGFRGWSGSARRQFFIERAAATPGYVAGPLPAGTWSVVLGGYEIPGDGLRWWLTISLQVAVHGRLSDGRFASLAGPATTPSNPAPGWYRGDLHSHTEHSDGENTIEEMARFARSEASTSSPSRTTNTTPYPGHRCLA